MTTNNITEPEAIPEFVHTALVPVANPNTAGDLLRLAGMLVHPEEGKVIALTVSPGDVDNETKTLSALEPVLATLAEEGFHIEMQAAVAPNIARGILDVAREIGADLIVLGIRHPVRGQVQFGTVVENVLATAPCDVLIYRTSREPDYKRIVIPIEAGVQAQVAARIGIRLSKRDHNPVEAMLVQGGHKSNFEGLAKIEETISHIPGCEQVKRTVISATSVVDGIMQKINKRDLVIIGFTERTDLERWMFGDIFGSILNQAQGPVVVVSRSVNGDNRSVRWRRRIINWLRPKLTRAEQDEIIRHAADMTSVNIDYATLIIVSATLATLGLLLNSVAVIIGAMLVAPLMSPLIGFSIGMVIGRVGMTRKALVSVIIGVMAALLVSIVVGLLLPVDTPTPEMLARGNPTLLDAAVALASGIIGAYATARKDIPAALAGVAIAAALMPPVCTIGLGIAFRDADLAFGATVLFATNIICIIAAGMIVFMWLGMSLREVEGVSRRMQLAIIALFILFAVPIVSELTVLTGQINLQSTIRKELSAAILPDELIEMEFKSGNPTRILATIHSTGRFTSRDVDALQEQLAQTLGEPVHLELIVQQVIRFEVDPLQEAEATPEITPEATAETSP